MTFHGTEDDPPTIVPTNYAADAKETLVLEPHALWRPSETYANCLGKVPAGCWPATTLRPSGWKHS